MKRIINNKKYFWSKAVLKPSDTIKKAFSNLEKTGLQIIFICSQDNKLLGTITDGDIRRGLLKGFNLNQKIIMILNQNPIVTKKKISLDSAKKIMEFNKILYLPVLNNFGKLIDVYNLREHNTDNSDIYDVVVMAGGMGKRLLPITKKIPKAMVRFNGKPLIEIVINKLVRFGFINFYISVNHLKKKIMDYLGSGSRLNISVSYLEEKKPLGTIGSLGLIKKISKNFIVINCDVITNLNFLELIKFHEQSNSTVTIATNIVETQSNFGELRIKGNKVLSFEEKPVIKKYNNAGVYVFKKSVLKFINKNKKLDINTFINLLLKKRLSINIFPLYENWSDIGIKSELKKYDKKKRS
jgi:dTDP-glucose pyrophosphorylase